MKQFKTIYSDLLFDRESFKSHSPVVSGQALTGAEIFRRQSRGLPVGCSLRSFNEINPFIEKFSIYDSIGSFRIRHGLVDKSELVDDDAVVNTESVNPPEDTNN